MKNRKFDALLRKISTNGKIDIRKMSNLTDDERSSMVYLLVKCRLPVVKDLIPEGFDMGWLCCMGYLEETKGARSKLTFINTTEQRIVYGIF